MVLLVDMVVVVVMDSKYHLLFLAPYNWDVLYAIVIAFSRIVDILSVNVIVHFGIQ